VLTRENAGQEEARPDSLSALLLALLERPGKFLNRLCEKRERLP
jgi:hypothetical protein